MKEWRAHAETVKRGESPAGESDGPVQRRFGDFTEMQCECPKFAVASRECVYRVLNDFRLGGAPDLGLKGV